MYLVTAEKNSESPQFVGAVLPNGKVLDLVAASRLANANSLEAAHDMIAFLSMGDIGMSHARDLVDQFSRESSDSGKEIVVHDETDIRILAPVPRPGKILHTSCNFDQHLSELTQWKGEGWDEHDWGSFHFDHPTGFLQAPSAVIGTNADVIRPRFTQQLDYEIELAIIIGKKAKYVSVEDAPGYIAGYAIFNDVSARDIQAREHANNVILLGKSFDTSAPLGPYLVTPDELKDPQNLDMELRVNSEVRQKASTAQMHYKIFELVSWWSNITLEPGDVITSGSPAGVAAGMENPEFLDSGDIIDAKIEGLGTLSNRVVVE